MVAAALMRWTSRLRVPRWFDLRWLDLRWAMATMCLVGSVYVAMATLWPAQQRVGELRDALGTLTRIRATEQAQASRTRRESPAQTLRRLAPPRAGATARTAVILERGAAYELSVERGTYRFTPVPGLSLMKLQMSFPVRGRYAAIRRWVREALDSAATLALEEFTVNRHEGEPAGQVDAIVQFALYTKASP